MDNKLTDMIGDSLSALRNKVKEEVVKSDFKRKLIGGISEEDVENYISAVRMQAEHAADELNKRIDELVSSRDKLKIEYNIQVESAEAEKKKLKKEIEEFKQSLTQYQEQCNAKDAQIAEMEKQHKAEVENSEIEPLKQKLLLLENALKDSQKQLSEERLLTSSRNEAIGVLTSTISKLEEQLKGGQRITMEYEKQLRSENMSIVKMLEENKELSIKAQEFNAELERVKSQVRTSEELKQQLEQERLRRSQAEKEMEDYLRNVSELKDKINSNQHLIANLFQKIGDKTKDLNE